MTQRDTRKAHRRAFEQMAGRRGYDLERNGELYANRITNDAWSFYWAGCSRQSPVEEAGPWYGGLNESGDAFLSSDDFAHDVSAHVTGDFGTREQKVAYVEELARRLNRTSGFTVQPDGEVPYEKTVPFHRGFYRLLHELGIHGPELRDAPLSTLLKQAQARIKEISSPATK
jgi:hypothetical protein